MKFRNIKTHTKSGNLPTDLCALVFEPLLQNSSEEIYRRNLVSNIVEDKIGHGHYDDRILRPGKHMFLIFRHVREIAKSDYLRRHVCVSVRPHG